MKWSASAMLFAVLAVSPRVGAAQPAPMVTIATYVDPIDLHLAPGQITTLYVTGALGLPVIERASGLPLPATLAGFSVNFREFIDSDTHPASILAVVGRASGCPVQALASNPPCGTVAITIQVPTDLTFQTPVPNANRVNQIIVSQNGVSGPPAYYILYLDNIHIVTDCDPAGFLPDCNPIVTRADGTVLRHQAVSPGEVLVVYSYGLGRTSPAVPTGTAPPPSGAVLWQVPNTPMGSLQLAFRFGANDLGAPWPWTLAVADPRTVLAAPLFAGLTPNFAGLYQVNFKVPTPPAGTPPCDFNQVQYNATVTLLGQGTRDSAGFCIQVPQN